MKYNYEVYGYGKSNLVILLISILLIIVGYLLMAGGASSVPTEFNTEVFSIRRITIAPIVTTIGYLGVIVAIMWRKKRK